MENLQYIGLRDLAEEEQEVVKKVTEHETSRLARKLTNIQEIIVHVKAHGEGKPKKYEVHTRVNIPSKTVLESSKVQSWELPAALHESFDDITKQVSHIFKTDVSRPHPHHE